MSWGITVLATIVFLGPVIYVTWFFRGATKQGWRWVDKDSRDTYVRIADTLITSSGLAVTLLMTLGRRISPRWMIHSAVVSLVVSIVFAVFFVLIFVRDAEVAIARHSEQRAKEGKPDEGRIGSLTNWQLSWILFMAWVAVTSFLWGFLCLGALALRI